MRPAALESGVSYLGAHRAAGQFSAVASMAKLQSIRDEGFVTLCNADGYQKRLAPWRTASSLGNSPGELLLAAADMPCRCEGATVRESLLSGHGRC
jgi:hypothetical protein